MPPAASRGAAPILALAVAIFLASISALACGNDPASDGPLDTSGIIADQPRASQTTTSPPQSTSADLAEIQTDSHAGIVDVVSADGQFTLAGIENLDNFKLSKSYDVDGLRNATGAVYGFFGNDPYNRRELEIRIYPNHATALDSGVDFADEATGPSAILTSSAQRWDEGITQRRACRANTRGSHHTGRCDAAKYGDYIVFGNLIVLCEGIDSDTALRNCNAFAETLQ